MIKGSLQQEDIAPVNIYITQHSITYIYKTNIDRNKKMTNSNTVRVEESNTH